MERRRCEQSHTGLSSQWWQKELESGRNLSSVRRKRLPPPGFRLPHRRSVHLSFCRFPRTGGSAPRAQKREQLHHLPRRKDPAFPQTQPGPGLGKRRRPVHRWETKWFGLRGGDELRAVTDRGVLTKICPSGCSGLTWTIKNEGFRFCRFEVRRSLLPGSQPFPALISNPVYFDVQRGSL